MIRIRLLLLCTFLFAFSGATIASDSSLGADGQTITSPSLPAIKMQPSVVIYTLSTCPHCRDAKQYLTTHNIPFTNREVDTNEAYMEELMKIYDSMGIPDQNRGVPLFIIGGKTKVKGFDKDRLEKALKEDLTGLNQ